ncbi:hypothetical protein A2999_01075 [Candidatus Wolfebacteria bacterium RIFCSPLOWO2_01_FULL_38_11]|uniref:PfkB family kinase, nonfunctional n=2 Tax=Candidatus Wolfeibacteriota TaxID=1752735 RepID=A0A0G0FUJ4_9BACT|nr:MAG: PfkB family kinase, nonfunctional [Candidatus Wolfebacteria bacterium GW2011_GWC1_37_10]OGM91113.1 MAG: hypothetical protein A2999_01075 [Candidatus Wolfebacteria bacterium RIFCSPLOWO2_01_FULL_38_11]
MFDVITIGTATRDVFLTSPFFRTIKDPKHLKKNGFLTGEAQCFALGGKIEIDKPIFTTGGGATNAAVTFSRQGLKTAALVKLGNDGAGNEIIEELAQEKIKPLAIKEAEISTAYSTILLSPTGERTILVYRGASENLMSEEIPFAELESKWAYVSPGKISLTTMNRIFDYLFPKTLIAFNPSKHFIEMGMEKLKPLLSKTKAFILNREEASHLTGIDYNKEKEIFKELDNLIAGIAVMTDGPNGVLVSDSHKIYKARIFGEKKLIDRTGAGDAFGSGFVAGLIHRDEECKKGLCLIDNIEYAIRLGSANATSVIEQIGAKAGILSRKEFEDSSRFEKLKIEQIKI